MGSHTEETLELWFALCRWHSLSVDGRLGGACVLCALKLFCAYKVLSWLPLEKREKK